MQDIPEENPADAAGSADRLYHYVKLLLCREISGIIKVYTPLALHFRKKG